jgi:hypothetical protein
VEKSTQILPEVLASLDKASLIELLVQQGQLLQALKE